MHATNRLLAQLPRAVLRELAPKLETVDFVMGQALHAAGRPWQVYFPLQCVVSVLVTVEAYGSLEVALVGCEGLAGFPLVRSSQQPLGAVIQTGGAALRLPGKQLLLAMRRHPTLQAAVHDYTASLIAQIATTGPTNCRIRPCRRTNAFWAPIATISESPVSRPATKASSTTSR